MFVESAMRSVFKAVSWRILATLTTALLVYAVTRRTDIAVTVGMLDGIAKLALYYFHERLWNRLNVGRRPIDYRADGGIDRTLAPPSQEHE